MMMCVAVIFRAAVTGVAVLVLGGWVLAETYSAGGLQIGNPWARATPSGASVGAGYLTITNTGKQSDRLVGGTALPAARFEVHATVVEQGVAKMRPVEGLEIKPGETIELRPGGMHVMFMGLREPLRQGQRVRGTLVFEKAGKIEIEFSVQPVGAPAPGGRDGHTGR